MNQDKCFKSYENNNITMNSQDDNSNFSENEDEATDSIHEASCRVVQVLNKVFGEELAEMQDTVQRVSSRLLQTEKALHTIRHALVYQHYGTPDGKINENYHHPNSCHLLNVKQQNSSLKRKWNSESNNREMAHQKKAKRQDFPSLNVSHHSSFDNDSICGSGSTISDGASKLSTTNNDSDCAAVKANHNNSHNEASFDLKTEKPCYELNFEEMMENLNGACNKLYNIKSNAELLNSSIACEEMSQSKARGPCKNDNHIVADNSSENTTMLVSPTSVAPKKYVQCTISETSQQRHLTERSVIIGNTYKALVDDFKPLHANCKRPRQDFSKQDFRYIWKAYVRGVDCSIGDCVSSVTFVLDKSYAPNHILTVRSPPFEVVRPGWAEFSLRVSLNPHRPEVNHPFKLQHRLVLGHSHDPLALSGLWRVGRETVYSIRLCDTPARLPPTVGNPADVSAFLHSGDVITRCSENVTIMHLNSDMKVKQESDINEGISEQCNEHHIARVEKQETLDLGSDMKSEASLSDKLKIKQKGSFNENMHETLDSVSNRYGAELNLDKSAVVREKVKRRHRINSMNDSFCIPGLNIDESPLEEMTIPNFDTEEITDFFEKLESESNENSMCDELMSGMMAAARIMAEEDASVNKGFLDASYLKSSLCVNTLPNAICANNCNNKCIKIPVSVTSTKSGSLETSYNSTKKNSVKSIALNNSYSISHKRANAVSTSKILNSSEAASVCTLSGTSPVECVRTATISTNLSLAKVVDGHNRNAGELDKNFQSINSISCLQGICDKPQKKHTSTGTANKGISSVEFPVQISMANQDVSSALKFNFEFNDRNEKPGMSLADYPKKLPGTNKTVLGIATNVEDKENSLNYSSVDELEDSNESVVEISHDKKESSAKAERSHKLLRDSIGDTVTTFFPVTNITYGRLGQLRLVSPSKLATTVSANVEDNKLTKPTVYPKVVLEKLDLITKQKGCIDTSNKNVNINFPVVTNAKDFIRNGKDLAVDQRNNSAQKMISCSVKKNVHNLPDNRSIKNMCAMSKSNSMLRATAKLPLLTQLSNTVDNNSGLTMSIKSTTSNKLNTFSDVSKLSVINLGQVHDPKIRQFLSLLTGKTDPSMLPKTIPASTRSQLVKGSDNDLVIVSSASSTGVGYTPIQIDTVIASSSLPKTIENSAQNIRVPSTLIPRKTITIRSNKFPSTGSTSSTFPSSRTVNIHSASRQCVLGEIKSSPSTLLRVLPLGATLATSSTSASSSLNGSASGVIKVRNLTKLPYGTKIKIDPCISNSFQNGKVVTASIQGEMPQIKRDNLFRNIQINTSTGRGAPTIATGLSAQLIKSGRVQPDLGRCTTGDINTLPTTIRKASEVKPSVFKLEVPSSGNMSSTSLSQTVNNKCVTNALPTSTATTQNCHITRQLSDFGSNKFVKIQLLAKQGSTILSQNTTPSSCSSSFDANKLNEENPENNSNIKNLHVITTKPRNVNPNTPTQLAPTAFVKILPRPSSQKMVPAISCTPFIQSNNLVVNSNLGKSVTLSKETLASLIQQDIKVVSKPSVMQQRENILPDLVKRNQVKDSNRKLSNAVQQFKCIPQLKGKEGTAVAHSTVLQPGMSIKTPHFVISNNSGLTLIDSKGNPITNITPQTANLQPVVINGQTYYNLGKLNNKRSTALKTPVITATSFNNKCNTEISGTFAIGEKHYSLCNSILSSKPVTASPYIRQPTALHAMSVSSTAAPFRSVHLLEQQSLVSSNKLGKKTTSAAAAASSHPSDLRDNEDLEVMMRNGKGLSNYMKAKLETKQEEKLMRNLPILCSACCNNIRNPSELIRLWVRALPLVLPSTYSISSSGTNTASSNSVNKNNDDSSNIKCTSRNNSSVVKAKSRIYSIKRMMGRGINNNTSKCKGASGAAAQPAVMSVLDAGGVVDVLFTRLVIRQPKVTREQFLSWPVSKQRAHEFARARAVVRYMRSCNAQDNGGADGGENPVLWNVRSVVGWARQHGYTPCCPRRSIKTDVFPAELRLYHSFVQRRRSAFLLPCTRPYVLLTFDHGRPGSEVEELDVLAMHEKNNTNLSSSGWPKIKKKSNEHESIKRKFQEDDAENSSSAGTSDTLTWAWSEVFSPQSPPASTFAKANINTTIATDSGTGVKKEMCLLSTTPIQTCKSSATVVSTGVGLPTKNGFVFTVPNSTSAYSDKVHQVVSLLPRKPERSSLSKSTFIAPSKPSQVSNNTSSRNVTSTLIPTSTSKDSKTDIPSVGEQLDAGCTHVRNVSSAAMKHLCPSEQLLTARVESLARVEFGSSGCTAEDQKRVTLQGVRADMAGLVLFKTMCLFLEDLLRSSLSVAWNTQQKRKRKLHDASLGEFDQKHPKVLIESVPRRNSCGDKKIPSDSTSTFLDSEVATSKRSVPVNTCKNNLFFRDPLKKCDVKTEVLIRPHRQSTENIFGNTKKQLQTGTKALNQCLATMIPERVTNKSICRATKENQKEAITKNSQKLSVCRIPSKSYGKKNFKKKSCSLPKDSYCDGANIISEVMNSIMGIKEIPQKPKKNLFRIGLCTDVNKPKEEPCDGVCDVNYSFDEKKLTTEDVSNGPVTEITMRDVISALERTRPQFRIISKSACDPSQGSDAYKQVKFFNGANIADFKANQ